MTAAHARNGKQNHKSNAGGHIMSMKIKVSYTKATEETLIMKLLAPIMSLFKVKKCEGTPPYHLIYFTPKKGGKADK